MAQARSWMATHKPQAIAILVVAVIAFGAAALGVATATDQPTFCGGACHEMGPYHAAWQEGPHAEVGCVECHVDAGTVPRVTHKMVAMKELWSHLTSEPAFPLTEATDVPNERCLRCHENPQSDDPSFDHAAHAKGHDCQDCHSKAGHEVTKDDLVAAGVFNENSKRVVEITTPIATVDAGKANVTGHKPVSCTNCHDMAATGCDTCHDPKHDETGPAIKTAECTTCHTAGEKFVFAHPIDRGDCASCHTPPKKEHTYSAECSTCHTTPGASWNFSHTQRAECTSCHTKPAKHRSGECSKCHVAGTSWNFKHPGSSASCTSCHTKPANHAIGRCTTCHVTGVSFAFRHPASNKCASCHNRPAGHKAGSCTTCHRAGVSWAFKHPASKNCTSCHKRPSGHKAGSCTTCHKSAGKSWAFKHPGSSSKCASCHTRPSGHKSGSCQSCHKSTGKSWKFSHPGQSSSCTSCHNRPSGHSSGSCASCHKAGSSWKFTHTSRTDCNSCHNPPSNHYGTDCASCHKQAGSSWAASFTHARIPGGEHTSKSFACKNCHPSGYSSHTCIKCHDSASGPKDD